MAETQTGSEESISLIPPHRLEVHRESRLCVCSTSADLKRALLYVRRRQLLAELTQTQIELADMATLQPKGDAGRVFCALMGLWSMAFFASVRGDRFQIV